MFTLSRLMLVGSVLIAGAFLGVGFVAFLPVSLYAALGLGAYQLWKGRWGPLSACGTARWASEGDVRGLDSGLGVGRLEIPPRTPGQKLGGLFRADAEEACDCFFDRHRPLVRLARAVHTATFAPTGAGKGVSLVIPFALECPDAMVVVDFKGEIYRRTAAARRAMGHRVVALNPFGIENAPSESLNSLASIAADSQLSLDDCRALAEAIVVRTPDAKDKHWEDSAEILIAAICAAVVNFGQPGDRSLQTVRAVLADPAKLDIAVQMLCDSPKWSGILARMGGQLKHYQDRERASVLTTANRHLAFLDTVAVAQHTLASTFDPADLARGKVTVYLMLPAEYIRTQTGLLRLWISTLLRAVVRAGLDDARKVHFVLDEAASLQRMECLDDALAIGRGYGVRLHYFFQSVGQLKRCFPEGQEQTLFSNTTQIYFGVNDTATAETVSQRLGKTTILVDGWGTSDGHTSQTGGGQGMGSVSQSHNRNANLSQQARELLRPEEVIALPQRKAIVFSPECPPMLTNLVRYYERPSAWQRATKSLGSFAVALAIFGLLGTLGLLGAGAAFRNWREARNGAAEIARDSRK